MPRRALALIGVLFLTIVVGMIIFTTLVLTVADNSAAEVPPPVAPMTRSDLEPDARAVDSGSVTQNDFSALLALNESLTLAHEYQGGTHLLTGTLALPTLCYRLSTSTMVAESYPEQVTLSITISAEDGGSCPQVIDRQAVSFTISASEEAVFADELFLNGRPTRLEIIPLDRTE